MNDDHRFRKLTQSRLLTDREREVLSILIGEQDRNDGAYTCQQERARVVEECEECPTIVLTIDGDDCPSVPDHPLPLEAAGFDSSGNAIRVQLFVRDGRINELEVYRIDGETIRDWPDPSGLSPT
jgi:hypothetical protein